MSDTITFHKMHGLGNDFMVIETLTQSLQLTPQQIISLADRRQGIGFDQLLLLKAATDPNADFDYQIYNADGQEVEHCGNGARCLAKFIHHRGLSNKPHLKVNCLAGIIEMWLDNHSDEVKVHMGIPQFNATAIPFLEINPNPSEAEFSLTPLFKKQEAMVGDIEINGMARTFIPVSIGNPHCVIEVNHVAKAPVDTLGKAICQHPQFPEQTNVEFMEIVNPELIKLRVYERGCGETLACGTGACAAMVAGQINEKLDTSVQVLLPGGSLRIDWEGVGKPVFMTGPANDVFRGEITL